MSLFHSILSGLQDAFNKESAQTDQLAIAVSSIINVSITKDQLLIKGTTLYIKVPPTLKMAINLNKEKILMKIKEINNSITAIA